MPPQNSCTNMYHKCFHDLLKKFGPVEEKAVE
jgi:hypothetical protein